MRRKDPAYIVWHESELSYIEELNPFCYEWAKLYGDVLTVGLSGYSGIRSRVRERMDEYIYLTQHTHEQTPELLTSKLTEILDDELEYYTRLHADIKKLMEEVDYD